MKIDTSLINLSSTHTFSELSQVKIEQELRFSTLLDTNFNLLQQAVSDQQNSDLSLHWFEPISIHGREAVVLKEQFVEELEKLRQILDSVIQGLNRSGSGCCSLNLNGFNRIYIDLPPLRPVPVMTYEYVEQTTYTHYEEESTRFFADGQVKTMDGRSMDFNFELNLAHEFFREDQVSYSQKGYHLIDPLIINMDNTLPQLAQAHFQFDLDMDGDEETLAGMGSGTGFLSLDKNHDGIINDGSELFGPSTGDGFGELSQYDLDNNRWIDENDDIFDQLTIWANDDSGEKQLTRLKDAGIGAIYLESVETPFGLKDENNHLNVQIKKSGIALNEDGSVSSVQEADWVV